MAKEIEINSSLLNSDEFKYTKQTLINASKVDGKSNFRVKTLHYIDDSTQNDDDIFFYNMLEAVRFLIPDNETTAYTTADHLIYLNCPGIFAENVRYWEFIYEHECLHQLWDTFAVGDKIKELNGKCDFQILNIASDCVINDYLKRLRKKLNPDGLITPEYLKEQFNVEYDPKNDTQFTLYLKLLKVAEQLKKDKTCQQAFDDFGDKKLKPKNIQEAPSGPPGPPPGKHSDEFKKGWVDAIKDALDGKVDPLKYNPKQEKTDYEKGYNEAMDNIKKGMEQGIGISKGGQGGQSGQGGDLPQIPWDLPEQQSQGGQGGDGKDGDGQGGDGDSDSDIDKMDKDKAAESAQKSADEAKNAANKAKEKAKKTGSKEDNDAADKAQDAADRAQDAADRAQDAANKGDKKGAQDAAKEARDAANEAKNAISDEEKDGDEKNGKTKKQNAPSAGNEKGEHVESKEDLEKIKKKLEGYIKEQKNKISGAIGDFLERCRKSLDGNKSGLGYYTNNKGSSAWNSELNHAANAYIKKRVFQKRRELEKTYKRFSRRAGYIKDGEPIIPGKRVKDNKLPIIVSFYIDVSGSMSSCIDDVWKACYKIAEQMKKKYAREKVVDEVSFNMFAFDTSLRKLKYGQKTDANGGTMGFNELLGHINKNSTDSIVNVILTDAGFGSDISTDKVKGLLDNINGILIFITNTQEKVIKKIAESNNQKLVYIEADTQFNIDEDE